MTQARILRIYLDDQLRQSAIEGHFKVISKIRNAFQSVDFRVNLVKNSAAERTKSASRKGYSLFYMDDPFHENALTLRKAYFFPFWRFETSAKRWEWEIARTPFEPEKLDRALIDKFIGYWRPHLFLEPLNQQSDHIVYIPLQGRLLESRSFQTHSPLDMIRSTLAYEKSRDIVIGIHPGEAYLPEELNQLRALVDQEPRLQLSSQSAKHLLQRCDYVVTENSSVALTGFFIRKPAVLFAQIDFHHIAANVMDMGPEAAIKAAPTMTPDFDAFVYWFLKGTAVHAGQPNAEEQILNAVRQKGWKV